MSRPALTTMLCLCSLATPVLAHQPTQGEQRSVAMALDLCAALVGVDPAGMEATAAAIPGLRLTKPVPLEMFPPENRERMAMLMNLPASENLRLANFEGHATNEGYFSAIRPDARACFTIATGVPGAANLLAQRLNSPNSGWKTTEEKGTWVGESRDRTPLALILRTGENSMVVAVLAKGATLDAATTTASDQRALALTEFCGRALLEGADAMPAIVRDFPGMTLSDPKALSAFDPKTSERIAKSLRISADTPVRIASFGEANGLAAIRTDAEICEITVEGTADASALFAERFGRSDSGWTQVKVNAAYQAAWKRPGRDGSLISVLMHSQADVTLIKVFTFRPGSQGAAETSAIAKAFVETCVAAIREWRPANPADFAPAFQIDAKPKGSMTMLRATTDATGLVLALRFDEKRGPDCVTTTMSSRIPVKRIFDAMVETFLSQPGATASETPDKSWRIPLADGRAAVLSGSVEDKMLVMTIHPDPLR